MKQKNSLEHNLLIPIRNAIEVYKEGKGYQPATGYEWVNSSPDDLRVKRELKGASKKNLEQTLNKDSPDHYRK